MNSYQLHDLATMVYNYCGINYYTNMTSLELKISRRLKQLNMNMLEHYIAYLNENKDEWQSLMELLTVNETYFYREEKQLHTYISSVVPQLKNNDKIRVWSAGCSSGEEAYSLAIMALERGYTSNDISITATDINKKVLRIGRKGEYSKKSLSFRRIPNRWLDSYFEQDETSYKVKGKVKNMVAFHYYNLLELSNDSSLVMYDIIFCRNVLIYFDNVTISNVIKGFYHCLKPGGYLFLGHTETITKDVEGFKLLHNEGTFYYRKEL